jgi:hypothetical protein
VPSWLRRPALGAFRGRVARQLKCRWGRRVGDGREREVARGDDLPSNSPQQPPGTARRPGCNRHGQPGLRPRLSGRALACECGLRGNGAGAVCGVVDANRREPARKVRAEHVPAARSRLSAVTWFLGRPQGRSRGAWDSRRRAGPTRRGTGSVTRPLWEVGRGGREL